MNTIKPEQFNYHCPVTGKQPDLVSLRDEASPFHNGAGGADAPGSTSVIFAPMEMYDAICEIKNAVFNLDIESFTDATIQLIAQPLSFMYSLGSLWNYLESVLLFFSAIAINSALKILADFTGVLGAAVCLLQGIYEGLNLKRSIAFRSKMNFDLIRQLERIQKFADLPTEELSLDRILEAVEKLEAFVENKTHQKALKELMGEREFGDFQALLRASKKEFRQGAVLNQVATGSLDKALRTLDEGARRPLYEKKFELIQSFYEPSEKQIKQAKNSRFAKTLSDDELDTRIRDRNFKKIARRIQPWLAAEIRDSTYVISEGLKTGDKEAYALLGRAFQLMDEQSDKAQIVHTIGLTALAFSVIAFGLAFFPGFWLAAGGFMAVGVGLGLVRYVVSNGYLGSRGWKFRKINLIPVSIRSHWKDANDLYNDPSLIKKWAFSEKPSFIPQTAPAA